jgi:hypothetical protein
VPAAADEERKANARERLIRQQFREPRLALDQRHRTDVVAVEMQQVKDEIREPGRVAGIRCGLDHTERRGPVGKDPHNSPSRPVRFNRHLNCYLSPIAREPELDTPLWEKFDRLADVVFVL